jgi:hypothetical protein
MTLILAIVGSPRWFQAYGILFLRRSQYVGCTQYMATRAAILDVEIILNQSLEEIAKREAPFGNSDPAWVNAENTSAEPSPPKNSRGALLEIGRGVIV